MPADLWILPLVEGPDKTWRPGTPRPFVNTPEFEGLGAFSPDGKLLAYMSSVQGAFQIFVKPFEGEGGLWRRRPAAARTSVWSKSAYELLFTIDDQIMGGAHRFDGKAFSHDAPRPWSTVRYATAGPTRAIRLHPNGKRAIVASPDTTGATTYDKVGSSSISSTSCGA